MLATLRQNYFVKVFGGEGVTIKLLLMRPAESRNGFLHILI